MSRLEDTSTRSEKPAQAQAQSSKHPNGTIVRQNLAADLAVLDRQNQADLGSVTLRRVSQLSKNGIEYEGTTDVDEMTGPTSHVITGDTTASDMLSPTHTDASRSGLVGRTLRYAYEPLKG